MRITNQIMQNNNLANINTNKVYQDELSTQMSTTKKISRPSDDPVIAIRALRLRSNVTEITQYYKKNIPDADAWLQVTESALKTLTSNITDMYYQAEKGSQGDLTSTDRQTILEQLEALGDAVYDTGDADYAGRYVFTGYRTDTSLSFQKAETTPYEITEQLDKSAIDDKTVVNSGDLLDWNESNYNEEDIKDITEQDISSVTVHRIRLAYDDCDASVTPTITYKDADGNAQSINVKTISSHGDPDPYTTASTSTSGAIYVPETGEILLSDNAYNTLMSLKDDVTTSNTNEAEIRVTYQKSDWAEGDLRPEHYFACTSNPDTEDEIIYNASYLEDTDQEKQSIEYDVGFNQTIRVNTTADECFQHGIGRTVDDLTDALQEVVDLEDIESGIKEQLEAASSDEDKETLQNQLDAVEKALTLSKDNCQKLFESAITTFQGYLDDTNLCITNVGTRSSKLELIENRMQTQKTTFEELQSDNEDVDITEVAINLSSAELTYEAALMATGKIMQTTLLNYI